MFTGLIEDVGRLARVEELPSGRGRRFEIKALLLDEPQPPGASLAVDGVCLTIISWRKGHAAVEVGPETLECTTLGGLSIGSTVNLERPLRLGDRVGGHLVSGHVDGVGRVERTGARGEALDLTIGCAPALLRYIVEKGSICIDGISLTVNRVDAQGFDVSLIPHTQTATALTRKRVGESVNLEVDLIGKYVEKLLRSDGGSAPGPRELTLDKLKEAGFVDK
jgi:riboflavin synthase